METTEQREHNLQGKYPEIRPRKNHLLGDCKRQKIDLFVATQSKGCLKLKNLKYANRAALES